MEIGYDAKRAFNNFSGLGNYSRTLLQSLATCYPQHTYRLYTPSPIQNERTAFMNQSCFEIYAPQGVYRNLPSWVWRTSGVTRQLQHCPPLLYHGLSGELPSGKLPCRSVVTVHDLIFLRYPAFYKAADRLIYYRKFLNACRKADMVIAISRQTADDMVRFLHIPADKIEILYQGCDAQFYREVSHEQRQAVRTKYHLPETFILNVGTVEARKNLLQIVEALPSLPSHVHLVVLGWKTEYYRKVAEAMDRLALGTRVHFFENASFADFPAIYQCAQALVYPSFFEGFGLPVLEGLACGVPVITSNVSSLPEAGGQAALYVCPQDSQEMVDCLKSVLSDASLRSECIAKGKAHAQQFTNEKMIHSLMSLYEHICR